MGTNLLHQKLIMILNFWNDKKHANDYLVKSVDGKMALSVSTSQCIHIYKDGVEATQTI